jgi:hypothetical protein
MFDPFEYRCRDKDGLLRRDQDAARQGELSRAVSPRVQNVGQKTREVLEWIPDHVEYRRRCAGHDGTYGVKASSTPLDEDRRPVFKRMAGPNPTT